MFRYTRPVAMSFFDRYREFPGLPERAPEGDDPLGIPPTPTDGLDMAIYWLAHISASCEAVSRYRKSLEEEEANDERRQPEAAEDQS